MAWDPHSSHVVTCLVRMNPHCQVKSLSEPRFLMVKSKYYPMRQKLRPAFGGWLYTRDHFLPYGLRWNRACSICTGPVWTLVCSGERVYLFHPIYTFYTGSETKIIGWANLIVSIWYLSATFLFCLVCPYICNSACPFCFLRHATTSLLAPWPHPPLKKLDTFSMCHGEKWIIYPY